MTEKDKKLVLKALLQQSRVSKILMDSYKKGGDFYNDYRRDYIESERLIHRIKLKGFS